MSNTIKILECRRKLLNCFLSYLILARGIEDLDEEDDIGDLESAIDTLLESFVKELKAP